MNSLAFWMDTVLRFMAAFAGASVVALAVYWVFRGRGQVRQFFEVVLPVFALYLVAVYVATSFVGYNLEGLTVYVAALLGLSVLATLMEHALAKRRVALLRQWVRSFFTLLCTLAVGSIFYVPPSPWSGWTPEIWGYFGGLLLGPLSIAGLRLLTRDLHLHPDPSRSLATREEAC